MVKDVLTNGRRFYRPDTAYIPVEFQGAVYRFGHSMVRPSYRINFTGDAGHDRFAFVFDPSQEGSLSPTDMRGGIAGPDRQIGWATFFPVEGQETGLRNHKRIDTKLSSPLFTLPHGVVRGPEPIYALAQRNLLRHLTWKLPSGQDIAAAMGATPLAARDLAELSPLGARLDRSTPLWYYVLREARVQEDGLRLGEVGGRIVAEVFLGMLQLDPASYLNAAQPFSPTLGRDAGQFDMTDLLRVAGVTAKR